DRFHRGQILLVQPRAYIRELSEIFRFQIVEVVSAARSIAVRSHPTLVFFTIAARQPDFISRQTARDIFLQIGSLLVYEVKAGFVCKVRDSRYHPPLARAEQIVHVDLRMLEYLLDFL